MPWRQGLSIHLVAEKRLRMQRARHVEADVIASSGGFELDEVEQVGRLSCRIRGFAAARSQPIFLNEIDELCSCPRDNIAPALNALEFRHHPDARQGFDLIQREVPDG